MAANPDDKDKKNAAEGSNTPSSPPSSSSTPPPIEPYRHKSNAPYSPYPAPSNHEYPPRSATTSSNNSTQSHNHGDPRAPILVVPPIATLRGRPTPHSRPPNRNDERCIIYCTQTAARRSVGQQPICKTVCWRRLFPQDYTPLDSGTPVQSLEESAAPDASQTPKSTTPGAGSPDLKGKRGNVVTMPDGRTVVERDTFETKPGIFGFDGRFVYFGRSRFRAKDRLDSMSHPGLSEDWHVDDMIKEDDPRKQDAAYMEFLRRYHHSSQIEVSPLPNQLFNAITDRFASLMTPASKYIESFSPGGAQEKFALRVWEKARAGDAWVMLKDATAKRWEEAKKAEAKDRAKKNGGDGKSGGSSSSSPPPPASLS